jgi:catechol 2,3-dioxygenase-like lactoylglutathione lyase family enzyme
VIDRFHHFYIHATDFERSLGFYRDMLGWSVTRTWGEGGKERGAILSGGGIKVVVAEGKSGNGVCEGPVVFLDIHDIEARFKAMPKGEHIVIFPGPTKWGTRWFVVKDPDGNQIAFEEVHSFHRNRG